MSGLPQRGSHDEAHLVSIIKSKVGQGMFYLKLHPMPKDASIVGRFLLECVREKPTHKVTLTSVSSSGLGKAESKRSAANSSMKKFLHYLNNFCWGHGHRRKGFEVGCIATVEGLSPWENWHVHLALVAPKHLNYFEFYDFIAKSAFRVRHFGRQIVVDPFDEEEWIDYCFKTGSDCLLQECIRLPKP
jgi:hypothetical protein